MPGSRSGVGSGVEKLAITQVAISRPTATAKDLATHAPTTGLGRLLQRAGAARVSSIPRTRVRSATFIPPHRQELRDE